MSWSMSLCQTVCRLGALWLPLALAAGLAEKVWSKSAEGKKTKEEGCFVDIGIGPILEDCALMIWLGTEGISYCKGPPNSARNSLQLLSSPNGISNIMACINVALSIHGDKFERESIALQTHKCVECQEERKWGVPVGSGYVQECNDRNDEKWKGPYGQVPQSHNMGA
ncbi:hypothetical protein F5141DRAFT_1070022 [Pisolithus sp. B1]|nr:hypothetical protein F5141DRAFT_1070022 [Pisolithus sp. B1]